MTAKWIPVCAFALSIALAPQWATRATAQTTFKVANWNLRGGQGVAELAGKPHLFTAGDDCSINSWGSGYMQNVMIDKIKNDPAVIVLGLNEAYDSPLKCARPSLIQSLLGWAGRSGELNGNAMIAKYGFPSGVTPEFHVLPPTDAADKMYVLYAPVCLNSACSATVDVFLAHWNGDQTNAQLDATDTRDFMAARAAGRPHVLIGDLNVYDQIGGDTTGMCPSKTAHPWGLQTLRDAGYKDAWHELRPTEDGFSATLNRNGCGIPNGWAFKRIDYAWSSGMTANSIEQFGLPSVIGETAISDHLGLKTQLTIGTSPPPPDTTAPTAAMTAPANGATVSNMVQLSASASDNVAVDHVEFWLDSTTLLGTDADAPYTISWDTTTAGNGSHSLKARAVDTSSNIGNSPSINVTVSNTAPPTTWTGAVNATATGSTLEKTSGCNGCSDAGGHTTATVPTSGGYVEFTPSTGVRLYGGLGTDTSTSTDPALINFAFSFWPNGAWDVRESGNYQTEGTFVAGDVFRVALESGVVKYYKNGGLVHVSGATPPASAMGLDATLFDIGAKVMNAVVSGGQSGQEQPVSWVSVIHASAPANTITKDGGCDNCPDAGGVSAQQVSAPGSFVQFAPVVNATAGPSAGVGLTMTLGAPTLSTQYDYQFSIWPTSSWLIYEHGTYKTEGAWSPGSTFKIAIEAGPVVKYYVNSTLVYTSLAPPSGSYSLAATILNLGVSVTATIK